VPPPQAHRDSSSQRYNTTNITWPLASQSVSRRQRQTRVIADELNELCTRPTTTNATSTPLTDPYQQPRHGDNDKSNESAGGGEEKCVSKRTFLPKEGMHFVSVFCNTRATIFVCLPGNDSRVSFVPTLTEHPVNRHCGLARTRR